MLLDSCFRRSDNFLVCSTGLLLILIAASPIHSHASDKGFETIKISRGERVLATIKAEVAKTPFARGHGLMFIKKLPEDQGMFFVFNKDTKNPFWMKNTYVSLDIIFIDRNQRIISIHQDAKPLSKELIYPDGFYRYVLEVHGGFTKKYGVKVKDLVSLPFFPSLQGH